jgi:hypothetical protein
LRECDNNRLVLDDRLEIEPRQNFNEYMIPRFVKVYLDLAIDPLIDQNRETVSARDVGNPQKHMIEIPVMVFKTDSRSLIFLINHRLLIPPRFKLAKDIV